MWEEGGHSTRVGAGQGGPGSAGLLHARTKRVWRRALRGLATGPPWQLAVTQTRLLGAAAGAAHLPSGWLARPGVSRLAGLLLAPHALLLLLSLPPPLLLLLQLLLLLPLLAEQQALPPTASTRGGSGVRNTESQLLSLAPPSLLQRSPPSLPAASFRAHPLMPAPPLALDASRSALGAGATGTD